MKKVMLIVACVLYVFWPIDLVPDFIPVLGWIDDLAAIVAAVWMCMSGTSSGPTAPPTGEGGAA